MNFVFRPYPTHPWFAEWLFEPSGCNSAQRDNFKHLFFKSQDTVGRIAPNTDQPEWALQVPVPQNSSINLLCNGFCAYFEHKAIKCGAEVITPEPGVLWGRFSGIPAPVLTASNEPVKAEEEQWLEARDLNVLLKIRDDIFCLVTKTHVRSEAEILAEAYFERDFEAALMGELDKRAGAISLFEDMSHHDALAVISVESMMKALRPAEGRIPHRWSQAASTEDHPLFDINELFPLAMAWSLIDIETAEELVLCALKIQTNAGAIPVHFSPHTTYSILEAPKPLLIKVAEMVWEVRKDAAYLDSLLPLLRRHMQWLLHHFDPKRRGIYCWKGRGEPITAESYVSDMATVDLAVLLLTELESLNRLHTQSGQFASYVPLFPDEQSAIASSITDQFWNDTESAFTTAYVRDSPVPLRGFPAFSPLLWSGLPNTQKSAILETTRASENLPGQLNVLSWKQSSMDGHSLLQQFLVFTALRNADPHGAPLRDFTRITLQGFLEWHTISLEKDQRIHIHPAMAAFIVNVQAMHQYRYNAAGSAAGRLSRLLRKLKADRTDLGVVLATLLIVFCVHLIYDVKTAAPALDFLETQMNSSYAERNAAQAMKNCNAIIEYYPDNAARARLLAANILMIHDEFDSAEALLKDVRKECPDAPGAMISLGLSLQLQGKFAEAETNYYEFCYLFDEIFPEVVHEVNQFRFLMQEEFRTPPKWQEIYRYQFMHEL